MNITKNKIEELLTHTQTLINQVYWFKQDFPLTPNKEHIGAAINWTDISERKHDFLKELVSTVASWVYSQQKIKDIVNERLRLTSNDYGNASSFLASQANLKFRPGNPQGQFGELILFNFIQHFFGAAPLLRKQKITTSNAVERFGADAIHFKVDNENNVFFIGESKCYKSDYKFKEAFEASLESIIKSINNFSKELDLYTYDDFIDSDLLEIAKSYKENRLQNVRHELVCLIAYNENKGIAESDESEIKNKIREIIIERCNSIPDQIYQQYNHAQLARINYIIFPIWDFDLLLEDFQRRVGA